MGSQRVAKNNTTHTFKAVLDEAIPTKKNGQTFCFPRCIPVHCFKLSMSPQKAFFINLSKKSKFCNLCKAGRGEVYHHPATKNNPPTLIIC